MFALVFGDKRFEPRDLGVGSGELLLRLLAPAGGVGPEPARVVAFAGPACERGAGLVSFGGPIGQGRARGISRRDRFALRKDRGVSLRGGCVLLALRLVTFSERPANRRLELGYPRVCGFEPALDTLAIAAEPFLLRLVIGEPRL